MRIIFDLETHSKYARAVSKDMTPENLALWAAKKGIDVIATGDMTHPLWIRELRAALEEAETGLFKLKNPPSEPVGNIRFVLSGEVSCIYSKGGKVRRVHQLIYASSFEIAQKININLSKIGNLASDGRPILGLDSKKLLQILVDVSDQAYVIPAHVWTPWFGLFGSKSGFDSLEECFEELTAHIFAVETGLSSDPQMNWRIPFLDDKAIVSGSDAHSLQKLGREATVVEVPELSYENIFKVIKSRDQKKFLYTIEFFPEEGKYHFDGHRDDGHSQTPEETKKAGGKCARCGKNITVGVMSRVEQLADGGRGEDYVDSSRIPYKKLIPLQEIIAESFDVGVGAKKVRDEYENLIEKLGNEFAVLLDADESTLRQSTTPEVAQAIARVRKGKVAIAPGYDGEYGKIKIFEEGEREDIRAQSSLF